MAINHINKESNDNINSICNWIENYLLKDKNILRNKNQNFRV